MLRGTQVLGVGIMCFAIWTVLQPTSVLATVAGDGAITLLFALAEIGLTVVFGRTTSDSNRGLRTHRVDVLASPRDPVHSVGGDKTDNGNANKSLLIVDKMLISKLDTATRTELQPSQRDRDVYVKVRLTDSGDT